MADVEGSSGGDVGAEGEPTPTSDVGHVGAEGEPTWQGGGGKTLRYLDMAKKVEILLEPNLLYKLIRTELYFYSL